MSFVTPSVPGSRDKSVSRLSCQRHVSHTTEQARLSGQTRCAGSAAFHFVWLYPHFTHFLHSMGFRGRPVMSGYRA